MSPVPPIAEEKTNPEHHINPEESLPSTYLAQDKEDSSSESSESCCSSSPERTSSPELPARPASPTLSRSTPASAMSISPANSEVGTRSISRTSGLALSASPPTAQSQSKPQFATPKSRHSTWSRRATGRQDRADLDLNWRASASGPASDRSSNSGGESKKTEGGDRADKDWNWRDHELSKPPSGKDNKKKGATTEPIGNNMFISDILKLRRQVAIIKIKNIVKIKLLKKI